jgi:hypothetical protein
VPDCTIVATNLSDLADLSSRKRRRGSVGHLKFAAERVLITQARKVRVKIDKLVVPAFDAARSLRKKFGEAPDRIFRANDPHPNNVARSRLKRSVLAQALAGIAMLPAVAELEHRLVKDMRSEDDSLLEEVAGLHFLCSRITAGPRGLRHRLRKLEQR